MPWKFVRCFRRRRLSRLSLGLAFLVALLNVIFITYKSRSSLITQLDSPFLMLQYHSSVFTVPAAPDQGVDIKLLHELSNQSYHEILDRCPATCQAKLLTGGNVWELQTMNANGDPKTVGGDEFYITYTDLFNIRRNLTASGSHRPTAAADIQDLQNGRYQLHFIQSPFSPQARNLEGRGILTIHFQYTCGIGTMEYPMKANWATGGSTVAVYKQEIHTMPPIERFRRPVVPVGMNLRNFHKLAGIGDSTMQQFLEPMHIRLPNLGLPLNKSTVERWKENLEKDIYRRVLKQNSTAIVVGSSVWDILEPQRHTGDWTDHLAACEILIDFIRSVYPLTTILWKSPTALHIHSPMEVFQDRGIRTLQRSDNLQKFHDRLKYMSNSRSRQLYMEQQQLCKRLGIPFLDIYQATYLTAEETEIGDGRHYTPKLNQELVHWFVNETHVETLWRHHAHLVNLPPIPLPDSSLEMDASCYSLWTEVVNAMILSMVSRRPPQWSNDAMSRKCGVPNLHSNAIVFENLRDKLLTKESLISSGYVSGGPSKQISEELFSFGSEYLYGMILSKTLPWPLVTNKETPQIDEGHSHSIVIDSNLVHVQQWQDCVLKILNNLEDLDGKTTPMIYAQSAKVAEALGDIRNSKKEWSIVFRPEFLHPLAFVQAVSVLALPEIILDCQSGTSTLFRGAVDYTRRVNAKQMGVFHVEANVFCCESRSIN